VTPTPFAQHCNTFGRTPIRCIIYKQTTEIGRYRQRKSRSPETRLYHEKVAGGGRLPCVRSLPKTCPHTTCGWRGGVEVLSPRYPPRSRSFPGLTVSTLAYRGLSDGQLTRTVHTDHRYPLYAALAFPVPGLDHGRQGAVCRVTTPIQSERSATFFVFSVVVPAPSPPRPRCRSVCPAQYRRSTAHFSWVVRQGGSRPSCCRLRRNAPRRWARGVGMAGGRVVFRLSTTTYTAVRLGKPYSLFRPPAVRGHPGSARINNERFNGRAIQDFSPMRHPVETWSRRRS
jgi:hypothetical protein